MIQNADINFHWLLILGASNSIFQLTAYLIVGIVKNDLRWINSRFFLEIFDLWKNKQRKFNKATSPSRVVLNIILNSLYPTSVNKLITVTRISSRIRLCRRALVSGFLEAVKQIHFGRGLAVSRFRGYQTNTLLFLCGLTVCTTCLVLARHSAVTSTSLRGD